MSNIYREFYDTFLCEMPWNVNGKNDFWTQLEMLRENLKNNTNISKLVKGVHKNTIGHQITYWIGDSDANKVDIIVDTEIHGKFCKVTLTSKNPNIPKGSVPYASQLYLIIKEDISTLDLVFSSDNIMSDDAIKLWKRMASSGHAISVYDSQTSKYELTPIASISDLEKYIGGPDKARYTFVLSENMEYQRSTIHSVNIMELKRIILYPLFEEYKHRDCK